MQNLCINTTINSWINTLCKHRRFPSTPPKWTVSISWSIFPSCPVRKTRSHEDEAYDDVAEKLWQGRDIRCSGSSSASRKLTLPVEIMGSSEEWRRSDPLAMAASRKLTSLLFALGVAEGQTAGGGRWTQRREWKWLRTNTTTPASWEEMHICIWCEKVHIWSCEATSSKG